MRTTVDLEPEAYRQAQALADARGETLGKVLGDALLGRPRDAPPPGHPRVVEGPGGLPEIHLGRSFRMDEVRAAIEDDD